MGLRHWSARAIRRTWVLGIAAELVDIGAAYAVGRANAPPDDPGLRAFAARMDSVDRGQLSPSAPLTPPQRARLAGFLHDSLGVTWKSRGGMTEVRLPPALAEDAGRGVTALVNGVAGALLLAAALYVPIPLVLIGLTAAWSAARWRGRRAAAGAHGV